MWVEDEEWNSFMSYLAQVVFQDLKKNVGGLVPALKFFVGMLRPI